ncbi:MAG: PTS lactose/cellobiose transporter subunit IIA [Bifidobacteriaceae bacterium]|jgi:PTS system cellobiose-specific IIA component|nr:PTS lactose/cellobiose transporter subunit IIA [Bifidobacteriaceae bacterium]
MTEQIDENEVDIAMNIIVDAGDARLLIAESFQAVAGQNFEEAKAKLKEAKALLSVAHGRQTQLIQEETDGQFHPHTLLFAHAQDTLMTIHSELNVCQQVVIIVERLDQRISVLEDQHRAQSSRA